LSRPGNPKTATTSPRLQEPTGHKCPSVLSVSISTRNSAVGERIRASRESNGLLQRELAASAGLPLRTVGRIERGEVDVRLSTLAKIAIGLGVPLKDLMP